MSKSNADERLDAVKKKQKQFMIIIGIILIVSVSIIVIFNVQKGDSDDNLVDYQVAPTSGNDIYIDYSEVSDGQFHYYSHMVDGVKVKYFMVVDEEGEVHTAFDACEVCYDAKKGYTQQGEYAKCMNCGRTFSVQGIGTKNADDEGCWPGYLPYSVVGTSINIKASDIEAGSYLFA